MFLIVFDMLPCYIQSLTLSLLVSAGIFKQPLGARNRVGIVLSYRPARLHTQPGGIGSMESILGLLKSFKLWALFSLYVSDRLGET